MRWAGGGSDHSCVGGATGDTGVPAGSIQVGPLVAALESNASPDEPGAAKPPSPTAPAKSAVADPAGGGALLVAAVVLGGHTAPAGCTTLEGTEVPGGLAGEAGAVDPPEGAFGAAFCTAPHDGQNRSPAGTSVSQRVQAVSEVIDVEG
jgi:hypothetical protein